MQYETIRGRNDTNTTAEAIVSGVGGVPLVVTE